MREDNCQSQSVKYHCKGLAQYSDWEKQHTKSSSVSIAINRNGKK